MINIQGAVYSDIGPVRTKNEDNLYWQGNFRRGFELSGTLKREFQACETVQLYAISDGMGGMARGEIASRIAVSELSILERKIRLAPYQMAIPLIDQYLRERSNYIAERNIQVNAPEEMMGATISILLIQNNMLNLVNLGDTAVYLFRQGDLKQISRDDSQAGRLKSLGLITQKEVNGSPFKNNLTNYLGKAAAGEKLNYYSVKDIPFEPGDLCLLCSDGLSGTVSREAIATVLSDRISPAQKVQRLIDLAENAENQDNITIILLEASACDNPSESFKTDEKLKQVHSGPSRQNFGSDQKNQQMGKMPSVSDSSDVQSRPPVRPLTKKPGIEPYPVSNENLENTRINNMKQAVRPVAKLSQNQAGNFSPAHTETMTERDQAQFERARQEAFLRQNQPVNLPPGNPPRQAGPYAQNRPVTLQAAYPNEIEDPAVSKARKRQEYDARYQDSVYPKAGNVVYPNQVQTSKPHAFKNFVSWLFFFLLFIGLGFLISFLLIKVSGMMS